MLFKRRFPDLGVRVLVAAGLLALLFFCVYMGPMALLTLACFVWAGLWVELWNATSRRKGKALFLEDPLCRWAPWPTARTGVRFLGFVLLAVSFAALCVNVIMLVTPAGIPLFLLYLLVCVWLTDSFAYFGGKLFGGLLLAPAISPSKTWSGVLCGIVAGELWCILVLWGSVAPVFLVVMACLPPIIVASDLFESWVKRKLQIKDSSSLLPGHGGLWDRLDGFLGVLLMSMLVMLFG